MRWRTANNNRRHKEGWARMDAPEAFYEPLYAIIGKRLSLGEYKKALLDIVTREQFDDEPEEMPGEFAPVEGY